MSKIQLKNIAVEPYFEKVSLIVEKGTSLAITGAKKNYLLQTLAGFLSVTKGSYHIEYHRYEGRTEDELALIRQEKIGFVAKEDVFLLDLTVLENLELPFFFHSGSSTITAAKHQRLEQLSKIIGIHTILNEKVQICSPFEQKCAAIIRACLNSPSLLLIEDPTAHLTEDEIQQLMGFLKLLKIEGISVIISSDHPYIIEQCDQYYTMQE